MCKLVRKAERMAENTTSLRGMDIISCVLYIVHPGTLQWQVPEIFPEGSQRFLKVPEGCLETLDRTPHRYNVRRVSWRRAPSVRLVTVPFDIRQWFDSIELFYSTIATTATATQQPQKGHLNGCLSGSAKNQAVHKMSGFTFLHVPGSLLLNLKHICTSCFDLKGICTLYVLYYPVTKR